MELDLDDFEGRLKHRETIFMIARFLEQAAAAESFEEAGRPLSDAVRCLQGASRGPDRLERPALDENELERLLDRAEWVLGQSSHWGRYPYSSAVVDGLAALAEQFTIWNGQAVDTPPIDTRQRIQMLQNAAHNAALTKEINERVHARRNRRVISLLEYRNARRTQP
ncbi:hypothetical protein [Methylopila sp. M107]|uniref:hypothetical protein n=1 Tax=Methylopila sp. M107 TaxID=1101190 RepID=UPI0003A0B0E6|nr:hypothetical protein [Methylopila sp. M107]